MPDPAEHPAELTGRTILFAVTGGIACFKAAAAVSKLVQAGASVTVLMTESATRFVGPLTFQSLSGRPVFTSQWQSDDRPDSQHVDLARRCDLLVIAPASANTIAKLAAGIADNAVTVVAAALPRSTPVLLAPAMNEQMWESPLAQRNLATLTDLMGWRTVGPAVGWQACRTTGPGRMSEPDDIVAAVKAILKR